MAGHAVFMLVKFPCRNISLYVCNPSIQKVNKIVGKWLDMVGIDNLCFDEDHWHTIPNCVLNEFDVVAMHVNIFYYVQQQGALTIPCGTLRTAARSSRAERRAMKRATLYM